MRGGVRREPAVGAVDPFLPFSSIAKLTLGDITTAFQYAVDAGREGSDSFSRQLFASSSDRLKEMIRAMDETTSRSRGEGVLPARTSPRRATKDVATESVLGPLSPSSGFGDVDALQFCAAMRLFAEWRLLRQVPEGYKGYAVGMGLGHKDVVQNVAKIEGAVHEFLEARANEADGTAECPARNDNGEGGCPRHDGTPPRSPTLRELLRFEIDHGVQTRAKLPRLKEKSAGMGLLWVRRQLQYQTVIFTNMLDVPSVFPSAIDAVRVAYSDVYNNFHGWAVQKIFNYSFQAAPEVEIVYRHMNPRKLEEVMRRARNGDIGKREVRFAVAETTPVMKTVMEEDEDKGEANSVFAVKSSSSRTCQSDNPAVNNQSKKIERTSSLNAVTMGNFQNEKGEPRSVEDVKANPFAKFGAHIITEWDQLTHHTGGEWDKLAHHVGDEWGKLSHHLEVEWNKAARGVVGLFQKDLGGPNMDVRGGGSAGLSGDALELFVDQEMTLDAQGHIVRYLGIVRPLLSDIAGLFEEMDMDDPTKV